MKAPFAFIVQRLVVVVMCSLVTNMAGHLIRVFLLYLYFFSYIWSCVIEIDGNGRISLLIFKYICFKLARVA